MVNILLNLGDKNVRWGGRTFCRIFIAPIVAAFMPWSVNAAQIVNVDYVVKYVNQVWGIDVPYDTQQTKWAANMEYLLDVVDYVNGRINGGERTMYGTDKTYATHQAVDTVATTRAIDELIDIKYWPFSFIPDTDKKTVQFTISAKGAFYINWADGSDVEIIIKPNTAVKTISHTYTTAASNYTIKMNGVSTGYDTTAAERKTAAISFNAETSGITPVKYIDGCLGCIFGTLADGTQPSFYRTFYQNENLTGRIPDKIFSGLWGGPTVSMFRGTFSYTGITEIPRKLFDNVSGQPGEHAFRGTFNSSQVKEIPDDLFKTLSGKPVEYLFAGIFQATKLTTIPEGLFDALDGDVAPHAFEQMFLDCADLETIPDNLFKKFGGQPVLRMYYQTFKGCSKLKEIPEHLFGNISGTAQKEMFRGTFDGCTSLDSDSAKINGKYLYEIWPNATSEQVNECYKSATHLTDYGSIPSVWKQ